MATLQIFGMGANVTFTPGAGLTADQQITEQNPGIQFIATETNGQYSEVRELGGALYWTMNAQFTNGQFSLQNIALPAYGIRITSAGEFDLLSKPASSAPWGPSQWTIAYSITTNANVDGLGIPKAGSAASVSVDGTLNTISYVTPYPNATDQVFVTVVTAAQSATLGTPQIVAKRANGFDFVIPGAVGGTTASVDWTTYGH